MWRISTYNAGRKKQLYLGFSCTHRICSWPPARFNDTLKMIRRIDHQMKNEWVGETLDDLKIED